MRSQAAVLAVAALVCVALGHPHHATHRHATHRHTEDGLLEGDIERVEGDLLHLFEEEDPNWFEDVFGIKESEFKTLLQERKIHYNAADGKLVLVRGEGKGEDTFEAGRFTHPRQSDLELRTCLQCGNPGASGKARFHIMFGNVAEVHNNAENKFATFQAASQFNCLEFVSEAVTPEEGITQYQDDRTQGPACAISCGAGTVIRNYFAMKDGKPQTKDNQLNMIDDFTAELERLAIEKELEISELYDALQSLAEEVRSELRGGKLDANFFEKDLTPGENPNWAGWFQNVARHSLGQDVANWDPKVKPWNNKFSASKLLTAATEYAFGKVTQGEPSVGWGTTLEGLAQTMQEAVKQVGETLPKGDSVERTAFGEDGGIKKIADRNHKWLSQVWEDTFTWPMEAQTPGNMFFFMRGGYAMTTSPQLAALNKLLEGLKRFEKEQLKGKLKIGLQEDVGVTTKPQGRFWEKAQNSHVVTQVYGSALPVAYNAYARRLGFKTESGDPWEEFASLILEASYDATFAAACINAKNHNFEGASKKLFLTMLGGGVFGNKEEWIITAIESAYKKYEDCGLEVNLVVFMREHMTTNLEALVTNLKGTIEGEKGSQAQ